MEDKEILQALQELRKNSKKRKFSQAIDLIINLKEINLKKDKVESFITLPNTPKKTKIAILVTVNLKKQAEENFDLVITKEEFSKYSQDKKLIKKIAKEYKFFVSQADLMTQVAASFGKFLAPRGKMPNPKAGCVVSPINPNLKEVSEKLRKTAKLEAKGGNMVKLIVAKEDMKDEQIIENIKSVYDHLINILPKEKNNIKNVAIKFTMSPAIKIAGAKKTEETKK